MFENLSIPTIVISYVALLLSLSIHEASHATAAYWLEDDTAARLGRMTLNPLAHMDIVGTFVFPLLGMTTGLPFIGWAKPVPIEPSRFTRKFTMRTGVALVSAAGPGSNVVVSLIALLVTTLFMRFTIADPIFREDLFVMATMHPAVLFEFGHHTSLYLIGLGGQLIVINILLAVFNMLPIGPLDGGGVLMGVLPYRWAQVFEKFRPHMFIVLLVLVFSGLLRHVLGPILEGIQVVLSPVASFLLGV